MTDDIVPYAWRRDEPDSPCVRVCLLHPEAGICLGCHRTSEEINGWNDFSAEARSAILADLPGRAGRLKGRRRGGRGRHRAVESIGVACGLRDRS
ncbi:MAG: DUF1289 domain-containing protein [Paracoccaceae bacterium]|nr:DUF1289 domain-containing protein [Paracoccaceae bacterium]